MQPLRELIEHRVATDALAHSGQLDARLEQLALELLHAHIGALRSANVVADDPANHESDGGTDRAANQRAGGCTRQDADAFFLRERVLVRRTGGTAAQRNRDSDNQGFSHHGRAPHCASSLSRG
ncbi:MAG: hypothetical protein C0P74_008220 [Gammaproteobacteria bacterium]